MPVSSESLSLTLQRLRTDERWQEIWQTVLDCSRASSALDTNIVAEGAFALAQLGQLEQAENLANQVLKAEANLLVLRALVVVRLKQNRIEEAFAFAQSAFQPPFKLSTPEDAARSLLAMASVYKTLNNATKVREFALESLRIFPLSTAFFLLGITELSAGNTEQGLKALQSGLALSPKDIQIWFLLGNTYAKLDRIEEMLQTYESALVHHPDNPTLMSTLGEYYAKLFRHAQAEILLRKVTQEHPQHLAGWVNLGKLFYSLQYFDESLAAFKTALLLSPDNAEIQFNTGQLLLSKSAKDHLGLKLIKQAYSLSPNNISIATKYAMICEIEGNKHIADAVLKKLITDNPNSSEITRTYSCFALTRLQTESCVALLQEAIAQELGYLKQQSSLSLFGDGSHPPMDVYDAKETLIAVCHFLEQLKVPYFLIAGTLLGIVRDGDLLPHDKDADLGIAWDVDRDWLMEQFEQSKEFAINLPRPEPEVAEWNISVIRKGTPIGVDFFFQKPDGDDWLTGLHASPAPWLQRFKQRKLTTIEYKGHLLPIPENPEEYLEEVYGPDWRIPMPSYDTLIAAENLCPEAYLTAKIIGYNRLYDVLRTRSWKKVLWYCEALKRFDNPPILDELAGWLRGALASTSSENDSKK